MFKICLLIALAVAGASAQLYAPEQNLAPEPYSYAYEADTHAASEQRDPSGKVTGYYTLVGDDGRQRRVEYVADETGFHARVATNEVGTKSENSADVEVQAAPPTQEQLAQGAISGARVINQAAVTTAPALKTTSALVQQPLALNAASYGYNGYYGNGLGYRNGYYGAGYGYGNGLAYANNGGYYLGNAGYRNGYALGAGNYNYHTPSAYYGAYGNGNGLAYSNANLIAGRSYATSTVAPIRGAGAYGNAGLINGGSYRYSSIGNIAPANFAYGSGYSTIAPARGDLLGSNNYVVLKKKRDAPAPQQ